ncbi:MAG TPA: apolipoprotein N-acyltransferase, partial [Geminicoccaceae bacterium]
VPYRAFFGRLGLGKLVENSVDFSPGPSRRTLSVPGLPPFSPLICFEAAFPGRAAPDEPRPAWLLNVTNDAWFGTSAGPYQHLAQARLRAVEEGLPLVRVANTGISVVTDAHGRVLARLGLNESGVLDARLPGALPEAPFARRHEGWLLPALLGAALALGLLVEIGWRRQVWRSGPAR